MNIHRFLNGMRKFVPTINIDGIRFSISDKTSQIKIRGELFNVPILEINNPKKIPFSYNALSDSVVFEFGVLNKLIGSDLDDSTIGKLIIFNNLHENQFFYPQELKKELLNCLHNFNASLSYKYNDTYYYFHITYIIDNNFEMYWSSLDDLSFTVSVKPNTVSVSIPDKNETFYEYDKEEIESILYKIYDDDPYTFEEPIWDCFSQHIKKYPTFFRVEWQYITVNIVVI